MRVRQWLDEPCVQKTKNGGSRSDAERQGQDSDNRKSRIFSKGAKTVVNVAQEDFEPGTGASGTNLLLELFRAAEFNTRGAGGFERGDALFYFFGGQQGEQGFDFVVERLLCKLLAEEIAEKAGESRKPGHVLPPTCKAKKQEARPAKPRTKASSYRQSTRR